MLIQARVRFTHKFVPPKCRKYRSEIAKEEIAVTIPEVSASNAPVAIETRDPEKPDLPAVQYRWWDSRLWQLVTDRDNTPYRQDATEELQRFFSMTDRQWEAKEAILVAIQERQRSYVLIEGTLWSEAEEPGYEVDYYSSLRSRDSVWLSASIWQPKPTHFRADAFEETVRYAFSLARKYDAKDSEDDLVALQPFITVHIPEAVRAPRRTECGHHQVEWEHLSEHRFGEKISAGEPLPISGVCSHCGAKVQRTYTTSGSIELLKEGNSRDIEVP